MQHTHNCGHNVKKCIKMENDKTENTVFSWWESVENASIFFHII